MYEFDKSIVLVKLRFFNNGVVTHFVIQLSKWSGFTGTVDRWILNIFKSHSYELGENVVEML